MITKWRLRNFKSVRSAEVAVKPLTVLSGVNSSGKSTVFQSMALVAQTIANQLERRPLLLNGHMVGLGEFKTVCSLGEMELVTGWELSPRETPSDDPNLELAAPYATQQTFRLRSIDCEVSFTADDPTRGAEVSKGRLQVVPADGDPASCDWEKWPAIAASTRRSACSIQFDEKSKQSVQDRFFEAVPDGCDLRHFLPVRLRVQTDSEAEDADFRARVLCGRRRPYQPDTHPLLTTRIPEGAAAFLIRHSGAAPTGPLATFAEWLAWLDSQRDSLKFSDDDLGELRELLREPGKVTKQVETTHLPGVLPEAIFYTETFFATKFRYLGPLRDEPRSVYPHPNKLDPVDLGRRGEFTAAAYHALQGELVRQIKMDELKEFGPLGTIHATTLQQAVDEWVRYLDVAHHVTSQEDKYGHVLLVGTSEGSGYEMTHVGTGVSQVLPILVLGLLSQLDDTLAIEHPELHLHPRVQTRLADFFLFLALTGRQVLVETHSEYIISRLRYRMVARGGDAIRDQVGILFASLEEGGKTRFDEIAVNEYGAIESWPDGFFDDATVEAEQILRAALERGGEQE
jgi:predicted ATPase